MFGKATWKQTFVVTENGKGKKSVPDRMSNPWLTSDDVLGGAWKGEFDTFWALNAEDFLASIPGSLGTECDYPLTRGNIHVRGVIAKNREARAESTIFSRFITCSS